jgi:hypothetical protein
MVEKFAFRVGRAAREPALARESKAATARQEPRLTKTVSPKKMNLAFPPGCRCLEGK